MSGMLTANHSAIGFLSNNRSERWRSWVIQRGSPFHHEICSTTPGLMPFSGVNAYSTSSLHPRSYFVRSRSKLVIAVLGSSGPASGGQAGNLHYRHSNNCVLGSGRPVTDRDHAPAGPA